MAARDEAERVALQPNLFASSIEQFCGCTNGQADPLAAASAIREALYVPTDDAEELSPEARAACDFMNQLFSYGGTGNPFNALAAYIPADYPIEYQVLLLHMCYRYTGLEGYRGASGEHDLQMMRERLQQITQAQFKQWIASLPSVISAEEVPDAAMHEEITEVAKQLVLVLQAEERAVSGKEEEEATVSGKEEEEEEATVSGKEEEEEATVSGKEEEEEEATVSDKVEAARRLPIAVADKIEKDITRLTLTEKESTVSKAAQQLAGAATISGFEQATRGFASSLMRSRQGLVLLAHDANTAAAGTGRNIAHLWEQGYIYFSRIFQDGSETARRGARRARRAARRLPAQAEHAADRMLNSAADAILHMVDPDAAADAERDHAATAAARSDQQAWNQFFERTSAAFTSMFRAAPALTSTADSVDPATTREEGRARIDALDKRLHADSEERAAARATVARARLVRNKAADIDKIKETLIATIEKSVERFSKTALSDINDTLGKLNAFPRETLDALLPGMIELAVAHANGQTDSNMADCIRYASKQLLKLSGRDSALLDVRADARIDREKVKIAMHRPAEEEARGVQYCHVRRTDSWAKSFPGFMTQKDKLQRNEDNKSQGVFRSAAAELATELKALLTDTTLTEDQLTEDQLTDIIRGVTTRAQRQAFVGHVGSGPFARTESVTIEKAAEKTALLTRVTRVITSQTNPTVSDIIEETINPDLTETKGYMAMDGYRDEPIKLTVTAHRPTPAREPSRAAITRESTALSLPAEDSDMSIFLSDTEEDSDALPAALRENDNAVKLDELVKRYAADIDETEPEKLLSADEKPILGAQLLVQLTNYHKEKGSTAPSLLAVHDVLMLARQAKRRGQEIPEAVEYAMRACALALSDEEGLPLDPDRFHEQSALHTAEVAGEQTLRAGYETMQARAEELNAQLDSLNDNIVDADGVKLDESTQDADVSTLNFDALAQALAFQMQKQNFERVDTILAHACELENKDIPKPDSDAAVASSAVQAARQYLRAYREHNDLETILDDTTAVRDAKERALASTPVLVSPSQASSEYLLATLDAHLNRDSGPLSIVVTVDAELLSSDARRELAGEEHTAFIENLSENLQPAITTINNLRQLTDAIQSAQRTALYEFADKREAVEHAEARAATAERTEDFMTAQAAAEAGEREPLGRGPSVIGLPSAPELRKPVTAMSPAEKERKTKREKALAGRKLVGFVRRGLQRLRLRKSVKAIAAEQRDKRAQAELERAHFERSDEEMQIARDTTTDICMLGPINAIMIGDRGTLPSDAHRGVAEDILGFLAFVDRYKEAHPGADLPSPIQSRLDFLSQRLTALDDDTAVERLANAVGDVPPYRPPVDMEGLAATLPDREPEPPLPPRREESLLTTAALEKHDSMHALPHTASGHAGSTSAGSGETETAVDAMTEAGTAVTGISHAHADAAGPKWTHVAPHESRTEEQAAAVRKRRKARRDARKEACSSSTSDKPPTTDTPIESPQ